MIKNLFALTLLVAAIIGFNACKSGGGYKKTEGGLEYNIVKEGKDTVKPREGDLVKLHFKAYYKDDKMDTLLFDSRKMNNGLALEFPLPKPTGKGDITEGLMMLHGGDSAVFRISIDSLKKSGMQLEPWMKEGNKIEYYVSLISVTSKSGQDVADEKMIQEYFSKNNIQASKTGSGVYYVIDQEGTGENARPGQNVTVYYTGRTIANGEVFDTNRDTSMGHNEPYSLVLGGGQAIQGWDEGLTAFKKGSKGRLFIPSRLGYGFMSPSPAIPAGSSLMFDIDVLDVKDAETAPAAMMQPTK